jgi:O-antigen ligase
LFTDLYRSGRLSQYLLFIACLAGATGLFASRALVALSPVVGLLAVITNPAWRASLRQALRNRTVWGLVAIYVLLLVSVIYTENRVEWSHQLFRQLPWIGIPLIFTVAAPLSAGQRRWVGRIYVMVAAAVATATVIKYLLNKAYYDDLVTMNQNIPSALGVFHIHFGIMLALAACWGVLLARQVEQTRPWRYLVLGCAVVAAVALHILAYRTGLLALYGAVLVNAGSLLLRRPKLAALLLVLALATPVVAYLALESVQRRVEATMLDVAQFNLGNDINDYSIARRMAAWSNASNIIEEHPLLGVAPADTELEMMHQFDQHGYGLRAENRVMIHNQYLHVLVSSGIVGLGLWLWVLLGPLLNPVLRRNRFVVQLLAVFAAATLVDSLLEMQLGFNLFVFSYGFIVVAAERQAQQQANLVPEKTV